MDEHVLLQSGNFVFDVQFLTFQFRNLRFNRHVACLLADGRIRSSYTLTISGKDTPLLPVRKSPSGNSDGLVGAWSKRDNRSSFRCSLVQNPAARRPKNRAFVGSARPGWR